MKHISSLALLLVFTVGLMAQNMHNGHEYVDLGLPSGTLWATCNVGANVPEEYGDYFAWGETNSKGIYDWSTYKHGNAYNALTKYCANGAYGLRGFVDSKGTLEATDDAAQANWGNAWRMPTDAELQELREQCTWEWTTKNEVQGYTVTGKNGNAIFLPAAGYRYDSEFSGVGKYGYYLSSSANALYPNHAEYTYFRAEKQEGNHISRYYGQTVRAVRTSLSQTTARETKRSFKVKGVTFNMIYVQGGTFTMGATSEQGSEAYTDENPAHHVTLSDYYIGETEVTQALWKAVMGTTIQQQHTKANSSGSLRGVGSNYPMYYISWAECREFVQKLSQLTGHTFRLPTEAEWEYAARGGSKSRAYKYSGSNVLNDVAWYGGNSGNSATYGTKEVRTKDANELGIYDMSGNLYEWCFDWYGSYDSTAQINPTGIPSGTKRVLRGGCRAVHARYCRVSFRHNFDPSRRSDFFGMRLVLVP